MASESTTHLGMSDRTSAVPPAQLETILASAAEALARAEESLRRAYAAHVHIAIRLPPDPVAFDAVILERYPEPSQS